MDVYASDHFVKRTLVEFFLHVFFPFEGESEVNDLEFELFLASQEEVLGLEVPVGHFSGVQVLQTLDYLQKYLFGFCF